MSWFFGGFIFGRCFCKRPHLLEFACNINNSLVFLLNITYVLMLIMYGSVTTPQLWAVFFFFLVSENVFPGWTSGHHIHFGKKLITIPLRHQYVHFLHLMKGCPKDESWSRIDFFKLWYNKDRLVCVRPWASCLHFMLCSYLILCYVLSYPTRN